MAKATYDPLALDAGELRHAIDIQAQTKTPDATTGAPSEAWDTVRSCKAKIATTATREAYQAGQFAAQVTHIITVRWTSTPLSAGMRVVFGARTFVVQAPPENVLERNRVLRLVCLEVDGQSGVSQ